MRRLSGAWDELAINEPAVRISEQGFVDYELVTNRGIRSGPHFNIRTGSRIIKVRSEMKALRLSKKISFRAGKTMPWPEVLHDFDSFCSVNPDYEPMRRLVYDLHSCASSDLHATQIMGGGLLLSPEEELHHNDNVLMIAYCPAEDSFHFEHRTISKHDDVKDAGADEVSNTLRLFVGYKFGIRLPKARPNKRMQRTRR